MRLINEHESLLKNFPVSQVKDANTPYLHLQYLMLSYISKHRGLPLNCEMALCKPGSAIQDLWHQGIAIPFRVLTSSVQGSVPPWAQSILLVTTMGSEQLAITYSRG